MGEQHDLRRHRVRVRGPLTALRYPERELVSVPAQRVYYEPVRPPTAPPPAAAGAAGPPGADGAGRLLDVADVLGRRAVETGLRGRVTIPEQNAAAALEVMSRFAVDPRWLVYLPPTMAPVPDQRPAGAAGTPGRRAGRLPP